MYTIKKFDNVISYRHIETFEQLVLYFNKHICNRALYTVICENVDKPYNVMAQHGYIIKYELTSMFIKYLRDSLVSY